MSTATLQDRYAEVKDRFRSLFNVFEGALNGHRDHQLHDLRKAGIARLDVGGTQVVCLTDGSIDLGRDVFDALDPARVEAAHPGGVVVDVNVYLLRHADGGIDLVDAGCGPAIYNGAGGKLPALLAELGLTPGDIDRVIFTHLHGDHAAGALDGDGQPVFPAARLVMHAEEASHWQARADSTGARVIAAHAGRIDTVADGADLGQGLRVWHLPGHTPGHIGLRLDDGFALIADILHSVPLQFPDPTVRTRYDTDGDLAEVSRRAALRTIVDEGLLFSASHLTGGAKFQRLQADGAGVRGIAA